MRVGDVVKVTNKGSYFHDMEGIVTEKESYGGDDVWYRVKFNNMATEHPSGVSFTQNELKPSRRKTPKKDAEALDTIADLVVKFDQGYITVARLIYDVRQAVGTVRNVKKDVQTSNL